MGKYKVGDKIRVKGTSWDGYEGRVVRLEGDRVFVSPATPTYGHDYFSLESAVNDHCEVVSHQFKVGDRVVDPDGDPCVVLAVETWPFIHVSCTPAGKDRFTYCADAQDLRPAGEEVLEPSQAFHHDAGKPQPSLIPSAALARVVPVFMAGLKKGYEARSWRKVPNAKARYLESLLRHTQAVVQAVQDEEEGGLMVLDSETGEPHLAAVVANGLILLDLAIRGGE